MIETIVNDLNATASQDRKAFANQSYPSSMEILGVRNPAIKDLFKKWWPSLKTLSSNEIIKLAKKLIDTQIFECNNIAYEIIYRHKQTLNIIGLNEIKVMAKNIDNWATVDTLAVLITGYAWREKNITDSDVLSWIESENHWWRRLGVVSTIPLNLKSRGGKGDPKRTLLVCEKVIDDRHDMVVKALSWALRELSKSNRSAVSNFMIEYEKKLAPRVKKEVYTKLKTGRKNG